MTPIGSVCPVCNCRDSPQPFRGVPQFAECRACGLLWQPEPPSEGQLNRPYEDTESPQRAVELERDAKSRMQYERSVSRRIFSHLSVGASILEIGFGAGGLLDQFLEAGCVVEGIEPSTHLYAIVQARLGDRVALHRTRLDDPTLVVGNTPFDAVVALDVIEHIPDARLLPRFASTHLKPGGRLFLQTPNALSLRRRIQGERWEQLAPAEHLVLHSALSLRMVLAAEGFEVETVRTVSGTTTEGLGRRLLRAAPTALLNRYALGNALWAVARKKEGS